MEVTAIGYVRIAPRERPGGRPSLAEQRRLVEAECKRRGWRLLRVEQDVRSGRTLRRPGLRAAIAACRAGEAGAIVVARLDRLTYAVDDLAALVAEAAAGSYGLVAPDVGLDLGAAGGAQVGAVLAEAARWHPRSLTQRTRAAVGARRRGRPSSTPGDVAERIRAWRAEGHTLQAICDRLNDGGVPTPRGGTHWRPSSLRAILRPRKGEEA
jgi:DNA invertase Pin-like site-specific DNA recombinase